MTISTSGKYRLACVECQTSITTSHRNKRYCSVKCALKNRNKNSGRMSSYENISTGTVGALTELYISADLLSKGYEVFRALSPHCGADLVIYKNGKIQRVECRTAYRHKITKVLLFSKRTKHKVDLFATFIPNEKSCKYFSAEGGENSKYPNEYYAKDKIEL